MYRRFFTFPPVIRIRLLLNFFTILTKMMVMPYTVVYFSSQIGVTLTTVLIVLIGILSIAGYLIGGRLTDAYGRRRIIMASELATGIGFVLIGLMDRIEPLMIAPIVLAFCAIYLFESMSSPAYSALIIDVSDERNRKEIYTSFMWITSIGFALGSVIGGFYFEQFSSILFMLVGITSFIACLCTYLFIGENRVDTEDPIEVESPLLQADKKERPSFGMIAGSLFFMLCIGTFLVNVLKEQFPNYISLRIVATFPENDFPVTGYNMIGLLNVEETIVIMCLAGVVLKLTARLSDRMNVIGGLALLVAGFVILSAFIHPFALALGMLCIAIGGLIYMPTVQTIVANTIPEKTRGYHLSILGLLGAVGGIVASVFIAATEYVSAMTITYAYVVLGVIVLVVYNRAVTMSNAKKRVADKGEREELIS